MVSRVRRRQQFTPLWILAAYLRATGLCINHPRRWLRCCRLRLRLAVVEGRDETIECVTSKHSDHKCGVHGITHVCVLYQHQTSFIIFIHTHFYTLSFALFGSYNQPYARARGSTGSFRGALENRHPQAGLIVSRGEGAPPPGPPS